MPVHPVLQPLIPSREQQQASGLPKPLLRWRDAEPLLEDDPRFGALAEEYRCGWLVVAVVAGCCMWLRGHDGGVMYKSLHGVADIPEIPYWLCALI